MTVRHATGYMRMILALALLASLLAACSGGAGGGNAGEAANAGNTGGAAGTAGADNAGGAETAAEAGEQEVTLFVDHPWWPLKDWQGKIPERISKATGIKVNVQVAADGQQLPLMIASGKEMPDLVFTYDNIKHMTKPDVSYTWDELIGKYTPDLQIDPLAKTVNSIADGGFYTVRNGFATQEEWKANPKALIRGGGLVIREDIMNELGNPKLESLDDLLAILGTVKQKYPDMIPLVMTPLQIDAYFRVQHGAPRFGFDLADGQVKYFINHPAQYDYYMFMNKLYREGYVVAENYTWKDTNQASQYSLTGKAFAQEYDVATADVLNAEVAKTGKPYRFTQVVNPLSDKMRLVNHNPGWSGLFVPKSAKHPEAAMKLIAYMRSEEGQRLGSWGIEGEDYTMAAEGYPVFNYNTSDTAVTNEMGVVWWGLLSDSGITEGLARYQPGKNQATPGMEQLTRHYDSNPLLGVLVPETDSEEQIIQTNIDTMIKTEETKIYLAKTEEEAKQAYDGMIKAANGIGMPQLEKWANEKYATAQEELKAGG